MTDRQLRIHRGLKSFGPVVAEFYMAGVRLYSDDGMPAQTYFLAHAAREIDSGLRHAIVGETRSLKKGHKGAKSDQERDGYITSILRTLNIAEKSAFAIKWHKLGRSFNENAHRGKSYTQPRHPDIGKRLWDEYEEILYELVGNYYALQARVDRLTKHEQTKEYIRGTITNFLEHEPLLASELFRKAPVEWFDDLFDDDVFALRTVHRPVQRDDGGWDFYEWPQGHYLYRVCQSIDERTSPETAEKICSIVLALSQEKIDDPGVWSMVIKSVGLLPANSVDEHLLSYVSTWLCSRFNNFGLTYDICDHLLPNYLYDGALVDKLRKAEIIVGQLLDIKEEENQVKPIAYIHPVSQFFVDKNGATILGHSCSRTFVMTFLNDVLEIVRSARQSYYRVRKAPHQWDTKRHGDDADHIYSVILRDLVRGYCTNTEAGEHLLVDLLSGHDKSASQQFVKKIAIDAITEHWVSYRHLFWEWCGTNDQYGRFSNVTYYDTIFNLLEEHSSTLSRSEVDNLKGIINQGYTNNRVGAEATYRNRWKMRWLSALRGHPQFSEAYETLSNVMDMKADDFGKDEHGVSISAGDVSPIHSDAIGKMSCEEIVKYTKEFNPVDRWEEPSVGGLGRGIKAAISKTPEAFTDDIGLFAKTQYVYNVLYGFDEAWRENREFDWQPVLKLCENYLDNPNFGTNKLYNAQDSWHIQAKDVVGVIANLICDATQKDDKASPPDTLPLLNSILRKLVPYMDASSGWGRYEEVQEDLVTYTFNSLEGKVLRATLDYALRRARVSNHPESAVKWEPDIKAVFEAALRKEMVDVYVLLGYNMRQLMYLDKDWITSKVSEVSTEDSKIWECFMKGYVSGKIHNSKDLVELMMPHYERAVSTGKYFEQKFSNDSVVIHLTYYYLWEFVGLEDDGIYHKCLSLAPGDLIKEMVNQIWYQRKSIDEAKKQESKRLRSKIRDLWITMHSMYSKRPDDQWGEVWSSLGNWASYLENLDNQGFELLLSSARHIHKTHEADSLIKNLHGLFGRDSDRTSAICVGNLLLVMDRNDYSVTLELDRFVECVKLIYDIGEVELADKICDAYGRHHRFSDDLKVIYRMHHEA